MLAFTQPIGCLFGEERDMHDYAQQLILRASPSRVLAALTTIEGLASWWTQDCSGSCEEGGSLRVGFGPHYKRMRVERLSAHEVRWLCTAAHIAIDSFARKDEWVGTELIFRLQPVGEGGTQLDFEHRGLLPSFECYQVCSQGWQHFLASLQDFVDSGHGRPFVPDPATAPAWHFKFLDSEA